MADGGRPIRARYESGYATDQNPLSPVYQGADAELYAVGERLRDHARHLAQNSAIIKACLDAREAKGVGAGLTYEPMVRDRQGNLLTKLNDAIRRWHGEWSERVDVTGELSRQEAERLIWRDWDTAGEVFVRKVYRRGAGRPTAFQLQLIPSELVPYAYVAKRGAVMGVERDDWGVPLRYWVYPYAPAASLWRFASEVIAPREVPAADMVHLRRQHEIGQTRGVTLFHSVINRVSDIAEFQNAHRKAARASAALFASINRSMDMDLSGSAGGGNDPEQTTTNPRDNAQLGLELGELTILDYLKPGEAVNFHTPSHPNQNAVEFVNQELRQFAASCRVAFSWIAYVFDRAYAAQRTEYAHAWEMIREDRAHFVREVAEPVLYREPLRLALLEGGRFPVRELRRADPATLYEVRIDGPVMPSLDPKTDREAAQIDEEMGWESRHGNIRRFGRNPAQVDAERAMDTAAPAPREPRPAQPTQQPADDAPEDDGE